MYTRCLHSVLACLLLSLTGAAAAQSDGADIQIRDGAIVATAADYEMDGTMWVVLARLDSNNNIYKSTDHGYTWQNVYSFNWSYVMDQIGLVVGEGDSNFVHVFVNHPTSDGDLYDLRFKRDGSGFETFPVAVGPDTIRDFAVCRDYSGSNYWLYGVTTNPDSPGSVRSLCFFRSYTYGREWEPLASAAIPCRDPHLAAGAGSYIYLATRVGDTLLSGINTSYFEPANWYFQRQTFADQILDPVIGAAFTLPESSATIWCLWSQNYNNSGDWDIKYSYMAGVGQGWSTPAYLAGSTAADEQYPDLRNYTSPGNQYINASYISDDNSYRSVYRRYANATTPDQWSDTLHINEGSAGTGSDIRPKLCYTPGGPFSGAGCVFVGAGLNGCWWNAPYPTGTAELQRLGVVASGLSVQPSVGRGPFHIGASPSAAVSIHDHAGRLVRALELDPAGVATWDGKDNAGRVLSAGVYFCRFSTGDYRSTEKLVLQK